MATTILVPIDFSEGCEHALDVAAQFFRPSGARFVLLHVVLLPPAAATTAALWVAPSAEELKALEQQVRDLATRHEVSATASVLLAEDVGAAILRTARESACDLIAMGTHGRGGVRRAFLGSVADYVSRHAECPVLTVRGPTQKAK